jgi:Pyruvate/2-oxoacid:ferredoxin oxidoreductase delta subunit
MAGARAGKSGPCVEARGPAIHAPMREMSRIRAPFVKSAACVGCGICQYRCHTLYVVQQQILDQSAIRVFASHEYRL